MNKKYLIFILTFIWTQTIVSIDSEVDFYDLILHSHDRGAYCLDGSPAGMYIKEGNG